MSSSRLEHFDRASQLLASLSDGDLAEALARATPVGVGIGGAVATMQVGGVPVFVKHIPLTDLERQPENVRSTVNLFGLPTYCQYGVSSPGFGAWRELEAHELTTRWVLSGQCASFPLLHHWRVMPRAAPASLPPDAARDVERQFAAWGGSEAVRERFRARWLASASIVVFLERFPHDLRTWLRAQLASGDGPEREALAMVERELLDGTPFMNARGLQHFDAHFENILTDGQHLYFSAFGQALWSGFTLTPAETAFLERHADFDRSTVVTILTNLVRDTPAGAALVRRYGAIAALVNELFRKLRQEAKTTPYPAAELARAWHDAGTNH